MHDLRLYSREGCCLCAGLEERLRQLDLGSLQLVLITVDIDHPETPSEWKARYDLEVPVLVLDSKELPRVSPRLSGDGLLKWLIKQLPH
jgi:ribosomal protein L7Ae-like RNA K-turn-binding protein